MSEPTQADLMADLTAYVKAANVAGLEAFSFSTRRACADCRTTRGKLRRACPSCALPVCDGCWPEKHTHEASKLPATCLALATRTARG